MATLEEYALARDTIQNLEGLRRDMRRNALGYKADSVSGRVPLTQLSIVMTQDAEQYLRRLGWQDRVDTAPIKIKLSNGLSALSVTIQDVRAAVTELKAAATTLRNAPKTTSTEIEAAADGVLTSVIVHEFVWD